MNEYKVNNEFFEEYFKFFETYLQSGQMQFKDVVDSYVKNVDLIEKNLKTSLGYSKQNFNFFDKYIVAMILSEKITVNECIDVFKNTDDYNDCSSLHHLISNVYVFTELFENHSITKENLEYLLKSMTDLNDFYRLFRSNIELVEHMIDFDLSKQLIDLAKKVYNIDGRQNLELAPRFIIDSNELSLKVFEKEPQYMFESITIYPEIKSLNRNTELLNEMIEKFGFKALVDKFDSILDKPKVVQNLESDITTLHVLLNNKHIFVKFSFESIENPKEELLHLLNHIKTEYELECLIRNDLLLKVVVDFDLSKELIEVSKKFSDGVIKLLELKEDKHISDEFLKYLLDAIQTDAEIECLTKNWSLAQSCLKKLLSERNASEAEKLQYSQKYKRTRAYRNESL